MLLHLKRREKRNRKEDRRQKEKKKREGEGEERREKREEDEEKKRKNRMSEYVQLLIFKYEGITLQKPISSKLAIFSFRYLNT